MGVEKKEARRDEEKAEQRKQRNRGIERQRGRDRERQRETERETRPTHNSTEIDDECPLNSFFFHLISFYFSVTSAIPETQLSLIHW